jgi:hypothetical protein
MTSPSFFDKKQVKKRKVSPNVFQAAVSYWPRLTVVVALAVAGITIAECRVPRYSCLQRHLSSLLQLVCCKCLFEQSIPCALYSSRNCVGGTWNVTLQPWARSWFLLDTPPGGRGIVENMCYERRHWEFQVFGVDSSLKKSNTLYFCFIPQVSISYFELIFISLLFFHTIDIIFECIFIPSIFHTFGMWFHTKPIQFHTSWWFFHTIEIAISYLL